MTRDEVETIITDFFALGERLQALGAISAQELCEQNRKAPDGYWCYPSMDWWLPPNITMDMVHSGKH